MAYNYIFKEKTVNLYFKLNYSLRKIANLLDLGKSTICRWVRLFKNKLLRPINNYSGRGKKLSTNQINDLELYVLSKQLITLKELQHWIFKSFKIVISQSTICRILNNKLSYKSIKR